MAPSADVSSVDSASGRALGSTEENWTRATATGTGVQVLGIALKRSLNVAVVSQACKDVLAQHAILRSQIVETDKGKLAFKAPDGRSVRLVEELPWPSLPVDGILSKAGQLRLPGDDGDDHGLSLALGKVMKDELNTPFKNAAQKISGPVDVLAIHVYSECPSRGRTLVILKFNSGALDRPSAAIVTQDFLTALNAAVDGKVPQMPESSCSRDMLLPALEEVIPKGKATKSLIQKGIDTLSYAISANKFSLFPFSSGYAESKHATFHTELLNYTLGKEGTAALLERSEQEKTNYSSALSAAFLKGVANVKELKDKRLDKFSFTNLFDCRSLFDPPVPLLALGNYTAGISQDEHMKTNRDFWDIARNISGSTDKEMGKLRHFSELPVLNMLFSQVLKRPSLTQKSSLRTALFSLFVDGPLNAQWENVDNLDLAGTCGPVASMHGIGPCFCLAESLVAGPDLNLTLVFASPVYDRGQMDSLAKSSLEFLSAATKVA